MNQNTHLDITVGKSVSEKQSSIDSLLIENVGPEAFEFIKKFAGDHSNRSLIVSTSTIFNIKKLDNGDFDSIVNISKVNSTRWINKFFEAVNQKLDNGGIYIGWAQTISERKRLIFNRYPWPLAHVRYAFDFLYTRVLPKIKGLNKIYFKITKGKHRVLSRPEILGRLYSCGFEIIEEKEINNQLYFAVRKKSPPVYDMNPSYGPLFKMKRLGQHGKEIYVYKLRTMHPYAEYLQEYVHRQNDLKQGGKFENDFRITTLGKFFRKFWLDELPMIINVFRGEIKIVGVRPLSPHYLSLYDKSLQEYRLKFKPGLIPPFYYDLPKSLDEIQKSELKYLRSYEKSSLSTDLKYFFGAMHNILIKKARSS